MPVSGEAAGQSGAAWVDRLGQRANRGLRGRDQAPEANKWSFRELKPVFVNLFSFYFYFLTYQDIDMCDYIFFLEKKDVYRSSTGRLATCSSQSAQVLTFTR